MRVLEVCWHNYISSVLPIFLIYSEFMIEKHLKIVIFHFRKILCTHKYGIVIRPFVYQLWKCSLFRISATHLSAKYPGQKRDREIIRS